MCVDFAPPLAPVTQLRDIQPEWKSCWFDTFVSNKANEIQYDPPIPLTTTTIKGASALPSSTPAQTGAQGSSLPSSTPAVPAKTSLTTSASTANQASLTPVSVPSFPIALTAETAQSAESLDPATSTQDANSAGPSSQATPQSAALSASQGSSGTTVSVPTPANGDPGATTSNPSPANADPGSPPTTIAAQGSSQAPQQPTGSVVGASNVASSTSGALTTIAFSSQAGAATSDPTVVESSVAGNGDPNTGEQSTVAHAANGASNNAPSTTASNSPVAVAIGSQTVTVSPVASGGIVIDQSTFSAGQQATIGGQSVSVGSSAIVILNSDTPARSTFAIAVPSAQESIVGPLAINSNSAIVVNGDQTLTPGVPAVTFNSATFSLDSSSNLVSNGQSIAAPTNNPFPTTGSPATSVSALVIGSQTLRPNAAITISGTTISFAGAGNSIFINGSPTPVTLAANAGTSSEADSGASNVLTFGSITATPTVIATQPAPLATTIPALVLGSQTLLPNSPLTISGTTISLASNGATVFINNTPTPLPTAASATALTIAGLAATPTSVQTSPDSAASSPASGSGSSSNSNSSHQAETLTLSLNGDPLTVLPLAPTAALIGTATLSSGALLTTNGAVISLAPGGTGVVVLSTAGADAGSGSGSGSGSGIAGAIMSALSFDFAGAAASAYASSVSASVSRSGSGLASASGSGTFSPTTSIQTGSESGSGTATATAGQASSPSSSSATSSSSRSRFLDGGLLRALTTAAVIGVHYLLLSVMFC